jgi:hypothetical protein
MIMEIILPVSVIITILVIIIIGKMKNRFVHKRLSSILFQSSEIASRNNLSFSSQLFLHKMILGVDGVNRKLVIIKDKNGLADCNTIDLNLIKECTVHKEYQKIEAGALKKNSLDQYLQKICLHLILSDGLMISLPFYEKGINFIDEMHTCEIRARDWESMLNKMRASQKRA